MNLEEKALFGLPIETEYGRFKPLSVADYVDCADLLQAVSFNKLRVLHEIRLQQKESFQKSKELTALLTKMDNELSLLEILREYLQPYFSAYLKLYTRCKEFDLDKLESLKEDKDTDIEAVKFQVALEELTKSNEAFDEIRMILLTINAQQEQSAFLDPLMQRKVEQAANFHARKNKSKDTAPPTVPTIITSIVAYTGINFQEVIQWNVTQLLHMYQRMQLFINYETTVLFATVSSEVKPENWAKNIEIEAVSNTDSSFAVALDTVKDKIGDGIKGK